MEKKRKGKVNYQNANKAEQIITRDKKKLAKTSSLLNQMKFKSNRRNTEVKRGASKRRFQRDLKG